MRAAYIKGPTEIELRDTRTPHAPDDGILVAVKACGVCGSDLRRWREGSTPESASLIAGHEIAAEVIEVGGESAGFTTGERVAIAPDVHCGRCYYCEHGLFNLCDNLHLIGITPGYDGGFAEYIALSAEVLAGGIIHRIPAGLSYAQAALSEPLSSVLAAHSNAGTMLGDTVVVMGAGPIGCLHIAVARGRGARVILSEPNEMRRAMALPFCPDLIVDPVNQNLVDEVRIATNGRGADIAICANPVAATHTQAVELVRKRGKVVLFGGLPRSAPMTSLNGNLIHYNELKVTGAFSYQPWYHALALETIAQGLVESDLVITQTLPLDEIGRAFETAASGAALKVMISMES